MYMQIMFIVSYTTNITNVQVECLNLIGWRMFWGVQLFSGKRTENVVTGSWPHYMSISLRQIISVISKVLQQKNNQNPQRHWPNK